MSNWPTNFDLLHQGEEGIREQSKAAIMVSPDLTAHITTIEPAISVLRHVILRDERKDQDDLTVRLLTIRLMNDITSALKLLMAGYYQNSTLIQRDVVETVFLLEDFDKDRSLIALWRDSDEKDRKKKFGPVEVRKRLDAFYGHTQNKRAEAYKLFCELAAHPHPKGFAMLRAAGSDLHNAGPFFDETALKATLSELARSTIQCLEVVSAFFAFASREDREIQFAAFFAKLQWMERFYERSYDRSEIAGIRAAIDRIPHAT